MQQTMTSSAPRVRNQRKTFLLVINILFYIMLAAAAVGFILYLYSNLDLINIYFIYLLQAAALTIGLSVVSMILAVIFGFLGALGRLSRYAPVRYAALVYVEVVRGTPILVQLLLWYYGIGVTLSALGFDPYTVLYNALTPFQENSIVPLAFSAFFYGVIGLSFNYGAYLTEVFRSGIETVDRGQSEAALSLGLNSGQTMRKIILPQAIRITIPPFTNYFITLIQDSALLSVLGVTELEQTMGSFAYPLIDPNQKLFLFIFGALLYFAICYPLSLLARYFEARFARAY